jgi:anti-anti-sigma factor
VNVHPAAAISANAKQRAAIVREVSPEFASVEQSSPERSWSLIEVVPGQFELAGEIDAHSAPTIRERVESAHGSKVVLDLAGVTFMDSSGLRVILQLHQQAQAGGPELVITHPSRQVIRLFDIAGLSDLLQPDSL